MSKPAFDVFLECRTGTGGVAADYHIIRWSREYSEQEAMQRVASQLSNPVQVKRAWYERVLDDLPPSVVKA